MHRTMGEQNGTRVLILVTILLLIISSLSVSSAMSSNNKDINGDDYDYDNDNNVLDKDKENKDRLLPDADERNNDDGEGKGQGGECSSNSVVKDTTDEHEDEIVYPLPLLLFLFLEHKTLEEVYSTMLKPMMPHKGTHGYLPPSLQIREDFGRIVFEMMRIDGMKSSSLCGQIDLRSLTGKYRMGLFIDQDNGRTYCLLVTTSIHYPWGNVIVDVGLHQRTLTKKLSFDCPHPKYDVDTGEQGIRLLKGTLARSWIVAGAHRLANTNTNNSTSSSSSSSLYNYPESDVAHSINNCFHSAVSAIKLYYDTIVHEDYTSVQLHGMKNTSCGSIDTFFSHGSCDYSNSSVLTSSLSSSLTPSSSNYYNTNKIHILQELAQSHPSGKTDRHVVAVTKDGSSTNVMNDDGHGCKLCGSSNKQGQLINGVIVPTDNNNPISNNTPYISSGASVSSSSLLSSSSSLADTDTYTVNGQFIHLEQKRKYRQQEYTQFWNDVFNEAYPKFLTTHTTDTTKSMV